MNDIILIGKKWTIIDLLNTFDGLKDKIKLCLSPEIDKKGKKIIINGLYIESLEEYKEKIFEYKNDIIISTNGSYSEFKNYLIENLNLNDNNIIYARDYILDNLKTNQIIHKPSQIRIDASTLCQLNCRECYMRKSNNGIVGSGYLKFEKFKNFIDKNKFINRIEISNSGEVFLNPDLKKILEYAYKNNIAITMDNGVNFNDANDETIEALVKYKVEKIKFSIDGTNQKSYSYYRRNGNLKKVLNNIKKLNYFKKKYNQYYPELIWQFIVMKHNWHEIKKVKKMASKYNMNYFFAKDYSLKNYKFKNGKKISKQIGFDINDNESKYSENSNYVICSQLLFHPQINWDGRLLGCCISFLLDWKVNVFENDFITVLNTNNNYRNKIYELLGDKNVNIKDKIPCSICEEDKKNIILNI